MNNIGLPPINERIKDIINDQTKGNVTAFSIDLGYNGAQKVNRLFKIDSRTGKYPTPSSTLISDISNKFDVNINWIISGVGEKYNIQRTLDNSVSPVKEVYIQSGTPNNININDPTVSYLMKVIDMLSKQGQDNADANNRHATANEENSKTISKLVDILEKIMLKENTA